ncbi:MAG TPA: hypothetical protein VGK25_08240 [Ignavibacteria bacterium]|jgi:hypothetical protein
MNKLLSVASIFLLFFVGITASISGYMLIYDPSGRPLSMSTAILEHSPFSTFFVPGLILFLFIGISCIITALSVMNDRTYSTRLIFYQGLVMIGWIIGQLIMIRQFHYLQILYLLIGLALVYIGYQGLPKKVDKAASENKSV